MQVIGLMTRKLHNKLLEFFSSSQTSLLLRMRQKQWPLCAFKLWKKGKNITYFVSLISWIIGNLCFFLVECHSFAQYNKNLIMHVYTMKKCNNNNNILFRAYMGYHGNLVFLNKYHLFIINNFVCFRWLWWPCSSN